MRPFLFAIAALAVVAGCGTSGTTTDTTQVSKGAPPKQEGANKMVAAAWPTDMPIHKSAKGEVVCPVLGDVVTSPETAVGHQDYNGVRYYFCCGDCPEKFKADPEKYAEKPDPRHNAPMKMGH